MESVQRVPPGDARLVFFSQRWAAHRLITDCLVSLFSPLDPANPDNGGRFKQAGEWQTAAGGFRLRGDSDGCRRACRCAPYLCVVVRRTCVWLWVAGMVVRARLPVDTCRLLAAACVGQASHVIFH